MFSHNFTPGVSSCRRKCIISVEEFLGGYINNQSCTLRVSLTAVTHGPKVAGSDEVPGNVKNIADSAGTKSGIVSENENVKSIAGTAGKNIAGTARS